MTRTCECGCGSPVTGRPDRRYASEACSKRARRAEAGRTTGPGQPVGVTAPKGSGTVAAVREELEAAGRQDTYLGAAALAIAEQLDAATSVMGFAPLVKELRATMAEALKGARIERTGLDELRARRDAKRGA